MTNSEESESYNIRTERRERRRINRREQMLRHGGSLAKVYQSAVTKRLAGEKARKKGGWIPAGAGMTFNEAMIGIATSFRGRTRNDSLKI